MYRGSQKQENQTVDRVGLLEELKDARKRSEAVNALQRADLYLAENPEDEEVEQARERLGDREGKRYLLRYYTPTVLLAFLILGFASGRWAISAFAGVVVALPAALVVWGVAEIIRWLITRDHKA